jgi:hypothetical protein
VHFANKQNKYVLGAFVVWILLYAAGGANVFSISLFALMMIAAAYINGEKWELILIFFFALGTYTLMFYQMKNDDGSLFNPGGWMQSGYKRGLFCYAPLGLFIVVTSNWVSWGFEKLDEQLRLFRKN